MDKKLVLFSIFVSLFILGGLKFADAVCDGRACIVSYADRAANTNSTLNNVLGGTSVVVLANQSNSGAILLNASFILWHNASGSFAKGTLTGISGNTSCTSNNCTYSAASLAATGRGLARFTWTLPTSTTNGVWVKLQFKNTTGTAINQSVNGGRVDVDLTRPTVSFAGNVTDGFVFYSRSHMQRGYPGQERLLLAKVVDKHTRNCTLWLSRPFSSDTLYINRTTANHVAGAYNISSDVVNQTKHYNVSFATVSVFPNSIYRWGVSCRDNATTANWGVAASVTANRTFYFDNQTPTFPATFGLHFEDGDPNSKDTSKTGLFTIGGVWTSELLETIKFTCDASDTAGIGGSTFYIKRPGETVFSIAGTSSGKTFDFKDTKSAGVYESYCQAADVAGNKTQSANFKFRLQAEDEGEVPGTPAYVKPFNVDFSKIESKTLVEPAGRILTVSFDGRTEHTVKFERVTSNAVTLVISSTPKTINLNVGDTQNLDVNDDGTNDFSVTLTGIIEGKASVEFKKLSGAAQVAREESQPTTSVRAGTPTTPTKGRSTTGIWIIVLIVVVGVIIYLVAARRKKKQ